MKRLVVLCGILLLMGIAATAQQVKLSYQDSVRIKQLFFTGLSDKLNENYAKSNESFSQIVAIDARNAAAWYEIALLNFRQNKVAEADTAIKHAVNLDQANPWYWKLLAEVYKSTGNMSQLIPVFDRLIALSPDQQSYYFDKANALAIAGRKKEADTAFNVLENKFGSSAALTRARKRLAAQAADTTAHEELNPSDAMAKATVLIAQKNFAAAVSVLEGIAAAHQNDQLFLALYGDVLYASGNLPAALETYQKVLKLTDQVYSVWEKALNIQILLGQYKQMIQLGEAALAVYPNQAILYYYMAFALHREERNQEALNHIRSALALDGDNKELQALILALQAEILIDERKTAAADTAFAHAVQLDPHNYLIMNNYAYYLALRNENLDKAIGLIDQAARALPENNSIADTYAFILLKGGRYELARTWIEKALQNNDSENTVYLEHYGDILFLLGEQEKAIVQWKKSRDAGNDSVLLKRKIDEKKYFK